MPEQSIYIFHQTDDGLWKNPNIFKLSDFGGRYPAVGDYIIDVQIGVCRNDPDSQTLLEVRKFCFNPRRPDRLALIVAERSPFGDELELMECLIGRG